MSDRFETILLKLSSKDQQELRMMNHALDNAITFKSKHRINKMTSKIAVLKKKNDTKV